MSPASANRYHSRIAIEPPHQIDDIGIQFVIGDAFLPVPFADLTGYFEVPFSTGGTSQRCIVSSTSCRSMAFIVNRPKRNQITG
ncbi:MAG: hypothetical protein HS103_17785 [Anaerolineales bacterium]|nr:hypothetical protein [Anaerolineales bacterium]